MNIFPNNRGYLSGYIIYKEDSRFGPRIQADLQLVYIHEGEAQITIDGITHYLGAGRATLLLPGHEELFQFSQSGRTCHGWCGIRHPEIATDLLNRLNELDFSYPFTARMRSLEQLYLPLRETDSTGLNSLHDILVQAMVMEFLSKTGILEQTEQPKHPAVERASAYMRRHFQENLALTTIAAHAGVTAAHLIRLFKEQFQTTPMAYLWQIRLEAAARLLRNTGLSAAEVAYECGFTNPHHFSRLFHQHYAYPPRAWRLREWGAAQGQDP